MIGQNVALSPGRFLVWAEEGEKSGLVFIAWVIVHMRHSITQILGNRILP